MTTKAEPELAQHHEGTDSSDTVDTVTAEALGEALPRRYYRSPQFIASFIVCRRDVFY